MISFTAVRKLDTGDAVEDFLIPVDEEFVVAWSYNSMTSDLSSMHDEHSMAGDRNLVTLKSDGSLAWNSKWPVFESLSSTLKMTLQFSIMSLILTLSQF